MGHDLKAEDVKRVTRIELGFCDNTQTANVKLFRLDGEMLDEFHIIRPLWQCLINILRAWRRTQIK